MAKEDIAKKVTGILEGYLEGKELSVYLVEYRKEGPDWKLRVILDKPENVECEYVSIEECEDVTRFLSDRLDAEDFIERSYTLEVSSPGLDRVLLKEEDFVRFRGRLVEVRLYQPIDGLKTFECTLEGRREDGTVLVEYDGRILELPAEKLSRINLAVVF